MSFRSSVRENPPLRRDRREIAKVPKVPEEVAVDGQPGFAFPDYLICAGALDNVYFLARAVPPEIEIRGSSCVCGCFVTLGDDEILEYCASERMRLERLMILYPE